MAEDVTEKKSSKLRAIFQQINAVVWEHYKIRKHHFIITSLEFFLPILIFVFVAYGRSKLPTFVKEYIPSTYNEATSDFILSTKINIGDTMLLYTPYTDFTDTVTREVQLKLNMYNEKIKGFDTKEDVMRYYRENGEGSITVVINFELDNNETLKYELQMYEEGVDWKTEKLYRDDVKYIQGAGSHNYLENQLLAFQWALDTSYIEILTNSTLNVSMRFQEFPYPPHWTDNGMNDVFVHLLPLLTVLCFIFLFPSILRTIVEEKSSGMKQLMKINGLKSWAYWTGWLFNAFLPSCASAVIVTILLTQRIFHEEYAPLQHVEISHLAALLVLYCSATIAFIFSFSVLFRNATLATVIGMTVWFLSYMIYVSAAASIEVIPLHIKYFASLIPHVALYYGFESVSFAEMRGRPIGLKELPRNCNDDLTMEMVLVMLLLDTILFLLIAISFETDPRGQYKINTLYKRAKKAMSKKTKEIETKETTDETKVLIDENIQEDENSVPLLKIQNLTKNYHDTKAVNNLSLTIYKNNLTVLLGHNGAGKTTTMSILAGLERETSGEVVLNHEDSANLKDRQLVSICPQENMLFPELSVKEHLVFFGKLKGLSAEKIKEDVDDLLKNKLKLHQKRHDLVKNLSGGMRRKLCIGIAIMGKPKLLILDEPTAGIDPEGRREIWDMILSCKDECTIIISTHLMEEAEELADKVAIIANGSLECYGTPMYLKQVYDVGYRLQVTCKDPEKEFDITMLFEDNEEANIKPRRIEEVPLVLEYRLERRKLPRILQKIENNKKKLSIEKYSILSTSLEDIFFKTLKKIDKENEVTYEYNRMESKKNIPSTQSANPSGCNFSKKFRLIREKKWKFLKKTSTTWISMIALFYLLVVLTFTMSDKGYRDTTKNGRTIQLRLDTYGCTNVYRHFGEESGELEKIYDNLVEEFSSTPHRSRDVSESIVEKGISNIVEYKTKLVVATEVTYENSMMQVNVMYSNQAIHGAPISLNLVTNTLLKHLTGRDHSIDASHTPLGSLQSTRRLTTLSIADNLLLWMILLPTGCLFSIIMFTMLPTLERNTLMIALARIYNLKSYGYWINNYLIDVVYYLGIVSVPIVTLLILSLCGVVIIQPEGVGNLILILYWYGFTIIPFTYLASFWAKSISTAFSSFLIPNICISPILAGVALSIETTNPYTTSVILLICAAINPHIVLTYTLSMFCVKMVTNHNWDMLTDNQKQMMCYENPMPCCDPDSVECLNDKAYIQHYTYLVVSSIVAILILLGIIIFDWETKCKHEKVVGDEAISVEKLQKHYKVKFKTIKAIKDLSFKIAKGKCFGLLGVNGAGKSTSFRLITRQEKPSAGIIHIDDNSQIGYCPQDHAMLGVFTGKELLTYFGKLRNPDMGDNEIDNLLKKCGLEEIANRPCGKYSGGNKRKLNTCIGLIGDPEVIALDEPTTGVDPENRMKINRLIAETKAKRSSAIIFTSHSMDECEKLCDTMGIMKAGEMATRDNESNNTIEKLKNEYNVGHLAQIKLNEPNNVNNVLNGLKQKFDEMEKLSYRNGLLTVRIKNSRWSVIFQELEELTSMRKDVLNYTVKESSLEQVFLQIAEGGNDNRPPEP